MPIPWDDLHLSSYIAEAGGERAVFADGVLRSGSNASLSGRTPVLSYEEAAEPIRESENRYPVRLLARTLYPTLAHHELRPMCEFRGIEVPRGGEAVALGKLFAGLIEEALSLDRELVSILVHLLPTPLSGLFERILVCPVESPAPTEEKVREDEGGPDLPPPESIEDALGTDGFVSRAHAAYELRAGQMDMAGRVGSVFERGGSLVVEAGPGTGKTFAYLVPAILHLRNHPAARVLVSTRTKQLQEQLYRKDLPFLVSGLAPELSIALLKGRENYLCLRRWDALIQEFSESLERDRLWVLAPLARWLAETETGDIEENAAFLSDPAGKEMWNQLCDKAQYCVEAFCPHCDTCFSTQARRKARKADLVVVNHSLLLGDRAADGVVLGKYSHLVIDEAHALEETARSAFTNSLSMRVIDRLADGIAPPRSRRTGWLLRIPPDHAGEKATHIHETLAALRAEGTALFRALEPELPQGRRDLLPLTTTLRQGLETVLSTLGRLEAAVEDVLEEMDDPELEREGQGHLLTIVGLVRLASSLAQPPESNAVHWFEREWGDVTLHATPLEVAPILAESLYPQLNAVVLTSATLSLGGDFEFFCRSIGLPEAFDDIATHVVASPFSYVERMRICAPSFLPPVTGSGSDYAEALAEVLTALVTGVKRKGLVLFTSYQLLHEVRERLPKRLYTLAQGVDGPRSKLVERFRRRRGTALLLGTDSFWEGVDLPGDDLEILVITRLPFSVPTDPIQRSLGDLYAERGLRPFVDLSLPQAILKLRQGVGRLIRTQSDHGIVVLTDSRVLSRSYGARFAASLPVRLDVYNDCDTLVREAQAWFDSGAGSTAERRGTGRVD